MRTSSGSSTISILYVEDDAPTRELVQTVLVHQFPAAKVHCAANGVLGMELFEEHRPEIVVADINLPSMHGVDLANRIHALSPDTSIIATTKVNDTQYLLDAIRIGITRYLLKPINLKALVETVDDCICHIAGQRQIERQQGLIRKLSRTVEQSPVMLIVSDAHGAIEYANPKFTEVTGFAAEEVCGQHLRSLLPSAPADNFEMIWSTINRGSEWHGEVVNRRKNGERFYEKISISSLTSDEGEITHFLVVVQDVTERKEAEERVRRLNDELEQRVKERTVALEASNAELEAFCYSVAHDLSAPLRGMSGFCGILLEEHADRLDEEGKQYLHRISAASKKMGALITDLLNLSRVTRTKLRRRKVLLSAMVREIMKVLAEQEPQRRIELAVSDGVVASCDPTLARQALENLLGNAWKYTSKEPCSSVEFGSRFENGETVYFIRDNGIGFDMAYAQRIFVPFERLHRAGEFDGTGVGLATVHRIATRHGGRVWAEGAQGKGATFYFTFG